MYRAFLDAVTSHLFVFEGDGLVRNFEGSFSEFVEFDKQREKDAAAATTTLARQSSSTPVLTEAPSKKDLGFSATAGVEAAGACASIVLVPTERESEIVPAQCLYLEREERARACARER